MAEESKPVALDLRGNENVRRVEWILRMYEAFRRDKVPDAPPASAITVWVGFPKSKTIQGFPRLGEAHFDCMEPAQLGGGDAILLHPSVFADPMVAAKHLLLETIRVSLEADVKNKKPFQKACDRVGLLKPWAAPDLKDSLDLYLRELIDSVEALPAGAYVIPVKEAPAPDAGGDGESGGGVMDGHQSTEKAKPKKDADRVRMFCGCEFPEPVMVTVAQLRSGKLSIFCGHCKTPYQPEVDVTGYTDGDKGGQRGEKRANGRMRFSPDTVDMFPDRAAVEEAMEVADAALVG